MKILYLHQYFNTPEMAGGTRSYEMARRFVEQGHEVEMITTWREETDRKDWFITEEAGIRVHWLPNVYSNKMGFADRLRAFSRFALAASKRAISLNGSIVFATSTPLTIAIPGVRTAKKLKVPMVFEVRDLWPELPIAIGAIQSRPLIKAVRMLESWAYRNSAHIVALSPGMKEGVAATGYPAEKISVIPNSCDNGLFQGGGDEVGKIPEDIEVWIGSRKLVLYTGTFGRINGASYLVDIAAVMRELNPEVRFLMIGDGYEYEEIIRRANAYNILENTLLVNKKIPKNELVPILQRATLVSSLFINLKEMWANSANKFFDGLAAGKPVMINYGGWQADLLQKSGGGIVVPSENARESAHILDKFIRNEDQLEKASKAARNLALEKFDRDLLAEKLVSVLEEVVLRYKET